jgi:hypothetical protein
MDSRSRAGYPSDPEETGPHHATLYGRAQIAPIMHRAALAVLAAFVIAFPVSAQGGSASHGPIFIDGDEAFKALGSGVLSGSGTPADPYVIEGWTIDVRGDPDAPGIHIRNTKAHAVVRDCLILKEKGSMCRTPGTCASSGAR